MKFNREHLEELTLQKIKEVNDEAGHRKYCQDIEEYKKLKDGTV